MERETLQRLRVIALCEMGHSPWLDTSRFQRSEKTKLVTLIQTKHATMSLEEIVREFDTLVVENYFCQGKASQNCRFSSVNFFFCV